MSADLSRDLQQALHYLQSGPAEKCVDLCNEILGESPELIQALYLRGCAAFQTGDINRSVRDLEAVHANHPEHLHAAYYLGRSLRASGHPEKALAPLRAAAEDNELEVHARYELATCLARLRRRLDAIKQYRAILNLQPANVQVAANLASLLERENRLEDAASWADKALAMDPDNETARMVCATLDRRNGNFRQAAQQLRKLTRSIENPINRSIVWNQLGQCLENLEDWDEAFTAFNESNGILKTHHAGARPDPRGPHGLKTLARIKTWLEGNPMAAWSRQAEPEADNIAFLVGFPRSGTTLLDRMLSAHPGVEVLEEKSLFSGLHQDWSAPGTLEALSDVNEAQIADAREIYRREMSQHRKKQQPSLVIDKLPLNLAYLFLIHRLFPGARVIFLQRHPLDACISCFSQAFELEASMAYFLDLRQTAQYYDAVMQVAALSLQQTKNPVYSLRYEDLVTSPRDQLEALLNFLELQWHDGVLEYRRADSGQTSNTPSYQQVSQELHSRSVGKWQHYSKQLEPVKSVLQPWLMHFGYE